MKNKKFKRGFNRPPTFYKIIILSILMCSSSIRAEQNKYDPTVLEDFFEVEKIYQRMRTDFNETAQCTHMAHVWAYEEFENSRLKSKKIFLFFSGSYIKKYKYPWWFHVSPMVYMKEGDKNIKIVLDRAYTGMPMEIKNWTDHFVKSGRACKKIGEFSKYLEIKYKTKEDCFLMEESMYYWLPKDIRVREVNGIIKNNFIKRELNYSYQKAFKGMALEVN